MAATRDPDHGRTARPTAQWLALFGVLIAGFGSAFALAHSTSGRTVNDPPRVVTVTAGAKVVGATAANVRLSTPGDLEGLVVSGKISSLARSASTQHTTQTTTQNTAGPGTTYGP